MTYENMNILISLATAQNVKIDTIEEFAKFACRVKL